MSKIDVIIILGGGTDGTLRPVLYTKERLAAFLKFKKKFEGIPVMLSGGYSMWFSKKPRYTEAEVMKNSLIKNGVPPRLIHMENKSRDTLGNAYHSKQVISKFPSWKRLLVITTKGHAHRSRWLFNKIFGKGYKFNFLEVPTKFSSYKNNPGRKKYENCLISIYKHGLRACKNGNDKRIMKALKKFHPIYSKSKQARELKHAIISAKDKYLGYTKLLGSTKILSAGK